jgi:hypothetical protein
MILYEESEDEQIEEAEDSHHQEEGKKDETSIE